MTFIIKNISHIQKFIEKDIQMAQYTVLVAGIRDIAMSLGELEFLRTGHLRENQSGLLVLKASQLVYLKLWSIKKK